MAGDTREPAPPAFYTVADLAERWRCSAGKVRAMIASGDLRCFRNGYLIRISAETVRAIETAPPPVKPGPTAEEKDAARAFHEDLRMEMRIHRISEMIRGHKPHD